MVHETVTLVPRGGEPISATSELVYNGSALAERSLSDRMPGITTKALARAAVKFAAAEAATRGSQHAVNKGDAPWVGLLVGVLAHGLAVASESADTRKSCAPCRMRSTFPAYGCRPANTRVVFKPWFEAMERHRLRHRVLSLCVRGKHSF